MTSNVELLLADKTFRVECPSSQKQMHKTSAGTNFASTKQIWGNNYFSLTSYCYNEPMCDKTCGPIPSALQVTSNVVVVFLLNGNRYITTTVMHALVPILLKCNAESAHVITLHISLCRWNHRWLHTHTHTPKLEHTRCQRTFTAATACWVS